MRTHLLLHIRALQHPARLPPPLSIGVLPRGGPLQVPRVLAQHAHQAPLVRPQAHVAVPPAYHQHVAAPHHVHAGHSAVQRTPVAAQPAQRMQMGHVLMSGMAGWVQSLLRCWWAGLAQASTWAGACILTLAGSRQAQTARSAVLSSAVLCYVLLSCTAKPAPYPPT